MIKKFYSFYFIIVMACQTFAQTNLKTVSDSLTPPVQLTAEQDHRRIMELLHIKSLRPGPSGNPKAANAANSDESIANPYPNIPNPLILNNGKKVISAEMWWNLRRSEINENFDRGFMEDFLKMFPKLIGKF